MKPRVLSIFLTLMLIRTFDGMNLFHGKLKENPIYHKIALKSILSQTHTNARKNKLICVFLQYTYLLVPCLYVPFCIL